MRVDRHVSCGTAQRLALTVRNMLLSFGVAVLLGHAKVDDVHEVGALGHGTTDEKVVWLDVTVDEVLLVDGLNTRDHLLGGHDDGLDAKLAAAHVKEILKRRAEQVDDQNVVQTLLTKVVHLRNTGAAGEDLVGTVFISQLRSIALARLKLDGNGLAIEQVGTFKDDTKRTLSNLFADAVMDADDVGARAGVRSVGGHGSERVVVRL